jgi:hypothetical protein
VVGVDLGDELVLRGEVAVADVEVLAGQADVVLGPRVHAGEQLRDPQVPAGELVGLGAQAAHGLHAREGDDRQGETERAEGAPKPHGERKIAKEGHAVSVGAPAVVMKLV